MDEVQQIPGKTLALPLVRRVIGAFVDVKNGIGNFVGDIACRVIAEEIALAAIDQHRGDVDPAQDIAVVGGGQAAQQAISGDGSWARSAGRERSQPRRRPSIFPGRAR